MLAIGCGVSPQPEPPSITSSGISITQGADGTVALAGEQGAVRPGGGSISALDLSAIAPAVSATVADDGSFSLELAGMPDDSFRLQASRGGSLSHPVDVTAAEPGGGLAELVTGPLDTCLSLADYVDFGRVVVGSVETNRIDMRNECDADVTVTSVVPLLGDGDFLPITGMPPIVIPSGASRSFVVTFAPSEPGPAEEVIDVELGTPEMGSRPITVLGEGVAR